MDVKIGGKYQHYKGTVYTVIAIANHSETLEELVVYHSLVHPEKVWVRPLSMFIEKVQIEGSILVDRFKFIENEQNYSYGELNFQNEV